MTRFSPKLCISLLLTLFPFGSFAAVYEASSLHNAVSRSETVQTIFNERWDLILEKNWNFDFFGRINWVPGFRIYDVNESTGEKEAVDMRLIRTYGGLTYLHNFGEVKKDGKVISPAKIRAGLTTIGYHYGLTRSVEIDRGDAGSETVTDYKFSQFFDDILAATLVWDPYGYIHFGTIINNQVEPNDDGTMSYFDSSHLKARWFLNFNILFLLDSSMIFRDGTMESLEIQASPNEIYSWFGGKLHPAIPDITLGFKMLGLYNDEEYDALWVNSDKSGTTEKESASLFLFSIDLRKKLFDRLYLESFIEFQTHSENLIEKRTGERLSFNPVRTLSSSAGYDFLHEYPNSQLIPRLGYSTFWDPAVAVHGDSVRYRTHGFFLSLYFQTLAMGNNFSAEFRTSYNDAGDLNRLVETVDKVSLEVQLTYSFTTNTVFTDTGDPFGKKPAVPESGIKSKTMEEKPGETMEETKKPSEVQP